MIEMHRSGFKSHALVRTGFETASRLLCALLITGAIARADELAIAPSRDRANDWALLTDTAKLGEDDLVLDGRIEQSTAIYKHKQWADFTLSAKFLVDPAPSGVLACGFMFRAMDSENYYYVHFDRNQAILVRSTPQASWGEIQRISGLNKPAGEWHHALVEANGNKIRVTLNGKLFYEATDNALKKGHIGFYAVQGVAHVKDIVISGKAEPSNREFKKRPSYLRFVEKDAGAGGYEAFPDVCRLDDGRLMCVYYAGYAHVSLPNEKHPRGGQVSCSFSGNEGRTWSESRVVYDGPHDDRDPSVVQLADGTILSNFFSLSRSKQPGKSREFDGSFLVASKDRGRTWSAPRMINREHACSSPIRLLKNGELILGMYGERDGVAYGGVVRSSDQGKTWSAMNRMDNNGAYLDAETDIIQLKDEGLYAALRGGKGAQMHWSRSSDNGRTWTVCEPIGFSGHCPYFHRTTGGTILLAHRIPATSLHYSLDECQTWSDNVQVDSSGGAYPSMVNLKDGSVLIVFYEEGGQSNIRARRFKASMQGIQWLGFE
ncbi:MAG TPA: sialidase family protein [Pirellulaceae bacterium]|nr:sialidase family protein [Pirellulaceae bacterium]